MTPRNQLARFDADMALAKLQPVIRAAGFMIANCGTGFQDELDGLFARALPGLLDLHPDLDSLDIEAEIADALADAAAGCETATYQAEAVRRSPGFLYRGRAPAAALTGLQPYHAAIIEARDLALARQQDAIRRTIREGARIGAARRELSRRRDAELTFLSDPTPATKAALTRRLHRQVAEEHGFVGARIPLASRMLVTGSQGTGKTATAIGTLAGLLDRIAVRFAVPLLEKAAEALADYLAAAGPDSLPAMLVRGRSADDPTAAPGVRMCPRHEVAESISQAGLSVRTTMCATCPLWDTCGYQRQAAAIEAMQGVGIYFMASIGLAGSSPAPMADLLIVDERLAAESVHQVPLDCLEASTLPYPGGEDLADYIAAHSTMESVGKALAYQDQLASLRGEGISADHLANAIRLLRPLAEPAPLPSGLTDRELKAALAKREDTPAAAVALRLLRTVQAEFEQPRAGLNGITLPDRHGDVAVCSLRRVRGLAPGAAVLALDGTGTPDQVRNLFGARMEHVECRVERDAHVTSPIGKQYSRQSITGADRKNRPLAGKAASAAKLREDVATISRRLPGPVLVVAAEQAETALADHLPSNTQSAHYGALRGRNTWESCGSVVTAGPAPIGLEAVEELARCHMTADPVPFISSAGAAWPADHEYRDRGWPFWATRGRRMRDGSVQPVEVAVHPDPRVQAMLEQIREAEVIQAIDRTRPVWHRREVVALDGLVLDLTYDACPSHRDLVAGGNPWERCASALGIIPLGARDLAEAHAFSTRKAAERALESTPAAQIEDLFEDRGYLIALYRRQGQRGSLSRALINLTRHRDPRSALELLLGPLAWFELLPPEAPPVQLPAPARPIVVIPAKPSVPKLKRSPIHPGRPPTQERDNSLAPEAAPKSPLPQWDEEQFTELVLPPEPPPWRPQPS